MGLLKMMGDTDTVTQDLGKQDIAVPDSVHSAFARAIQNIGLAEDTRAEINLMAALGFGGVEPRDLGLSEVFTAQVHVSENFEAAAEILAPQEPHSTMSLG